MCRKPVGEGAIRVMISVINPDPHGEEPAGALAKAGVSNHGHPSRRPLRGLLRMRLGSSAPLYHSSRGCNTFGIGRRFAYIRRVGPKATTRGIRPETGLRV